MWHIETSINGAFECSEHFGTSGGTLQSDVEYAAEWTRLILAGALYIVDLAVAVCLASVDAIQLKRL